MAEHEQITMNLEFSVEPRRISVLSNNGRKEYTKVAYPEGDFYYVEDRERKVQMPFAYSGNKQGFEKIADLIGRCRKSSDDEIKNYIKVELGNNLDYTIIESKENNFFKIKYVPGEK